MIMKDSEIIREYKEAKYKRNQVTILADENICTEEEILRVLITNGQNVTEAKKGKIGGDNDKILNLIYTLLDEVEEEIKETERKYMRVVECLRQYGEKE